MPSLLHVYRTDPTIKKRSFKQEDLMLQPLVLRRTLAIIGIALVVLATIATWLRLVLQPWDTTIGVTGIAIIIVYFLISLRARR